MKTKLRDMASLESVQHGSKKRVKVRRAKAVAGLKREYYHGRPLITEEEMARKKCPFPPEPEWEEEWKRWEAEQAAK